MTNSAYKEPEAYDALEFRDDAIPYLKGSRIRADDLYCRDYKVEKRNVAQIAEDRSLPSAAVAQAIVWCTKNDDLVTRVLAKEREEAGVKD